MVFFRYLEVKKQELQQLAVQKNQKQSQISAQRQRLQTMAAEIVALNTTYALYRDCDLDAGKRVVANIALDLEECVKPKQILATINPDFQALNLRKEVKSKFCCKFPFIRPIELVI